MSNTVFGKNFTKEAINIPDDFEHFEVPEQHVANDGGVEQSTDEGLVIVSAPYWKRSSGITDHTKFVVFTKQSFDIISSYDVELSVEAAMSFQSLRLTIGDQLGAGIRKYGPGISNIRDDPRLSAGVLILADLSTGMIFDFILSDTKVYALYEHLPISQDTAVFTYAIPVLDRPDDLDTPLKLRIGFNRHRNAVTWYINDNVVFTVPVVGLPLPNKEFLVLNGGGKAREVKINSLKAGFGLFTLLDFFPFPGSYEQVSQSYMANNDYSSLRLDKVSPLADLGGKYYQRIPNYMGQLIPQTRFIYNGQQAVDGQGGILKVRYIKVIANVPDACIRLCDVHCIDMTKNWPHV